MRTRIWHVMLVGLCGIALLFAAPGAEAFFPLGVFLTDLEYGDPLRIPLWTLNYMDTNGDGDVSGANEGIPITFQGGDDGWTVQEMQALQDGFEVWERVPSSFLAFQYTQPVEQPLETSDDLGSIDFYNYVANDAGGALVPAGFAGITFISYVAESGFFTYNGQAIEVTGPQILDADIAIYGDVAQTSRDIDFSNATDQFDAGVPLSGLVVQLAGMMAGLGQSPMSNTDEVQVQTAGGELTLLVDPLVYADRVFSGSLQMVGVTPSMYPNLVYTDLGNDIYRLAWEDLAPDDIAGITFLYPRGDLSNFFTLQQEARYASRAGFPTAPIAGGFIEAWCDVDNNPNTPRVPMFSALTGMYENQAQFSGFFRLYNLFRQIESPTGVPFTASYTLTLSELEPPDGFTAEFFDSLHNGLYSGGGGFAFSTNYPHQTFLEGGENIMSRDRHDEGTPLMYDPVRAKVVSAVSGRTLEQMLPGTRPMFGESDAQNVCPLTLAARLAKTQNGPRLLRQFRDNVLLTNALGAAAADAYYRMAPTMSAFLMEYPVAMRTAQAMAELTEWGIAHARMLAVALLAALGAGLAMRRRAVRAGVAAGAMLAVAIVFAGGAAEAQAIDYSIEKAVSLSDDVLTGEVTSLQCRMNDNGQIITDVSIRIEDTMKGALNRSGTLHFSQIGGEVNGITTYVPQYPRWRQGEEVVVLMKRNAVFGHMAVYGVGGKFEVKTDEETGKKYVVGSTALAKLGLDKARPTIEKRDGAEASEDGPADGVDLDAFKAYLASVAAEQAANEEAAQTASDE